MTHLDWNVLEITLTSVRWGKCTDYPEYQGGYVEA